MSEHTPTWCPGCGNFPILRAAKKVIKEDLGMETKSYVIVSGIGQAAKMPHYFGDCNAFNGLHGRALSVATGIKIANHKLKVIVFSGDGDLLAEGGNHFIHAIRRNIGVTCFLHNNQVYGLTKGQASPTSDRGYLTQLQKRGVVSAPFNHLRVALSLGAGFIARTFAGFPEHMDSIISSAIKFKGFAIVDILQPCVTFNKKNTYSWYKERAVILDEKYDKTDLAGAFKMTGKWDDIIPLGILYEKEYSSYEEQMPALHNGSLACRSINVNSDGSKIYDSIW